MKLKIIIADTIRIAQLIYYSSGSRNGYGDGYGYGSGFGNGCGNENGNGYGVGYIYKKGTEFELCY